MDRTRLSTRSARCILCSLSKRATPPGSAHAATGCAGAPAKPPRSVCSLHACGRSRPGASMNSRRECAFEMAHGVVPRVLFCRSWASGGKAPAATRARAHDTSVAPGHLVTVTPPTAQHATSQLGDKRREHRSKHQRGRVDRRHVND